MLKNTLWHITQLRRQLQFNRMANRVNRTPGLIPPAPPAPPAPAYAAIVCMIRGEDDYLVEWIEFHRLMGVDHFYLYDNATDQHCAAATRRILAPYLGAHLVTYVPWPDIPSLRQRWDSYDVLSLQQLAYGHCIQRFRKHVQWFIKIDVDEFVFPVQERFSRVCDVLRHLGDDRTLGVSIRRAEFGSGGHIHRPSGLVIENYRFRAAALGDDTKCIGNSNYLANDRYSMAFEFNYALHHRLRGKIVGTPRHLHGPEAEDLLQINHYQLKSREEYDLKFRLNSTGYMAGKETGDRFGTLDAQCSEFEDSRILRFVPALREQLGPGANLDSH